MAAGEYSFEIEQGVTLSKSIGITLGAGGPLNISGYKIRMMARHNYDDAAPVISLSTIEPPGGITITDGPNGRFQIAMSAAQTAALNFSKVRYDLELETPGGAVTRLLYGEITLSKENTKG